MTRVAKIDRFEGKRHGEKTLQLGHAALVVPAAAGDGEDDIVVAKTFRVAVTMKCVGHALILPFYAAGAER